MRKVVALAIVVVMLFALAIPAFADSYVSTKDVDSVNTTLIYGVSQSYMVYIPSHIIFSKVVGGTGLVATAQIGAKDIYIAGDETLNIAISSQHETTTQGAAGQQPVRQWWLKDTKMKADGVTPASVPVKYTATMPEGNGTVQLYNGKNILSVDAPTGDFGTISDASGEVTITFTTAGTAQDGAYQDILTFFVSVDKDPWPHVTA